MKIRCPHCSNPIEVIDESSFDDVECPSCGSSFNLAKDTETLSYRPAVGKTVAHFELFEHLGTGAFGTVWKARDTELDRTVAVKVPRKTSLSAEETEQFLREARAAAQVRHPNIVSVHEVGRTDSTVYIIADLVEGLTLTDWLSGQSLTPRESAELCLTIVNALHHAHECGIVHRDLKPSNIMLDQDGQPHVMDFGLAKREAGEITVTVEGQILGTPAYMSPEQARGDGHNVDRGSDIYSMGVILFEMLTNERPFRGSVRMLIYQVIYEEAPSPRQFNATVPKDLETICLKCLEKDPAMRFRTAEELGAEFQRFLNGEPILARPVSRIERTWRWAKRNPLVATLSTGLAAVLLFLAIAGPVVYFREKALRVDAVTAANDANDATILALTSERQAQVDRKNALRAANEANQAKVLALQSQKKSLLEADKALHFAGEMEQARADARNDSYFSQMIQAQQAVKEGSRQRALNLLGQFKTNRAEHDVRGFEWGYLQRQCYLSEQSPTGPGYPIDGTHLPGPHGTHTWHTPDGAEHTFVYGSDVRHQPFVESTQFASIKTDQEKIERASTSSAGYLCGTHSPNKEWVFVYDDDIEKVHVVDVDDSQIVSTYDGHSAKIVCAVFSPDSSLALTGSNEDAGVHLWESQSGEKRFSFSPGDLSITDLQFSPDGDLFAVVTQHGEISIIDVVSGKKKWSHRLPLEHGYVRCALFHPDSSQYYVGYQDGLIQVWDVAQGTLVRAFHDDRRQVMALTFSKDGRLFASCSTGNVIRVRDLETRIVLRELLGDGSTESLAFSADGTWLAGNAGSRTTLWNLKELPRSVGVGNQQFRSQGTLTFSHDGKVLASAAGGRVELWDPQKGVHLKTLAERSFACDFHPTKNVLAVGVVDEGRIDLIDPVTTEPTGEPLMLDDTSRMVSIDFSNDGLLLAVCTNESSIVVWNLETRERVLDTTAPQNSTPGNKPVHVEFSPDGKELYCHVSGPMGVVYDLASRKIHRTLVNKGRGFPSCAAVSPKGDRMVHEDEGRVVVRDFHYFNAGKIKYALQQHSQDIYSVAYSSDGRMIASGSGDRTVKLWDADSGRLRFSFEGHSNQVRAVTFSPDGRLLVSADFSGELRFWRSGNRTPIEQTARELAFDPVKTDRLLIGRNDGTIDVWNTRERKLEWRLKAHVKSVQSIDFSPDGKRFASTGLNGTVRLWKAENGEFIAHLPTSSKRLERVAFSPDGRFLVSSTWDMTSIRDAQNGEILRTVSHLFATALDFTPDSRFLVSADSRTFEILLIAPETGLVRNRFSGHEDNVVRLECSPDGSMIASTSFDGNLRIWDIETGKQLYSFACHPHFDAVCRFTRDSKEVIWKGAEGQYLRWRLGDQNEPRPVTENATQGTAASCSADGQYVATNLADRSTVVCRLDDSQIDHVVDLDAYAVAYRFRNYVPYETQEIGELTRRPEKPTDLSLNTILTAEFSPDGDEILTAGRHGVVNLWDAASLQQKRTILCEGNSLSAIYSADGERIITASYSALLRIWERTTGRELYREAYSDRPLKHVRLSHSGKEFLTYGGDRVVRVHDAVDGRVKLTIAQNEDVLGVAYSPNDQQIVTHSSARKVRLWDLKSKTIVKEYSTPLARHVFHLPDQSRLICVGREADAVTVDLETDGMSRFLKSDSRIVHLVYSPDQSTIATGHLDGTILLWDSKTLQPLQALPMIHLDIINRLTFSPDGTTLASVGSTDFVKLWNIPSGELLGRLHRSSRDTGERIQGQDLLPEPVEETGDRAFKGFWMDVFPDQQRFAVGCQDGVVRIFEIASGKLVQELHADGLIQCVSVSADGRKVCAGYRGGVVRIWDLSSEQLLFESDQLGLQIRGCGWSLDSQKVFFTSANQLYSLTVENEELQQKKRPATGNANQMMFSPDRSQFVVANSRGNVTLFETATMNVLDELPQHNAVSWAGYSPSGKLVSSIGYEGDVRIWDVKARKVVAQRTTGLKGTRACFLSDKRVLFWDDRRNAFDWNLETDELKPSEFLHNDGVFGARLANTDRGLRLILTGGPQGMIGIWDVKQAKLLRQIDLRQIALSE